MDYFYRTGFDQAAERERVRKALRAAGYSAAEVQTFARRLDIVDGREKWSLTLVRGGRRQILFLAADLGETARMIRDLAREVAS